MFQVHLQPGEVDLYLLITGQILIRYGWNPVFVKCYEKRHSPSAQPLQMYTNSNKDLSSELQYCHLYIVNSNVNVAQSLQKIESDNIDFPFIKRQFWTWRSILSVKFLQME